MKEDFTTQEQRVTIATQSYDMCNIQPFFAYFYLNKEKLLSAMRREWRTKTYNFGHIF